MIVVSDIHFGSGWDPRAVASAIITAAQRSRSRVLIVAGDLTQDAQDGEYDAAHRFVSDALAQGIQVVCTPGNHDFGRWRGEKVKNERARNRYSELVFGPISGQSCTVAARDFDTVSVIGDDVFVALRSTHAHLLRPNRIRRNQIEWAVSTLRANGIRKHRLHLVTHRSLWQDAGDKHPDMHRGLRLEQELLGAFPFSTFIHGHNHRFVFEEKKTPKMNTAIHRLGAPTVSCRHRGEQTGFVHWDPENTASTRLIRWEPSTANERRA